MKIPRPVSFSGTRSFDGVLAGILACATLALLPATANAEYHHFDNAEGITGTVQEVRWPYWAESTYNALYYQSIAGTRDGKKAEAFFYGGVPHASPEYPKSGNPANIIWSFWPPSGCNGEAVKPVFVGPTMYAPPHIGEGASGKVSGKQPTLQTGKWYRMAFRLWQPADGTPNVGYAAKWFREPDTGVWQHYGTMRLPFSPTGMNGISGFNEDFSHGNRNPRRTDYRNMYYFKNGAWASANHFTPSVRQKGERGTAGLIENGTAAFFETCTNPEYKGATLDFDAGKREKTFTINQPAQPAFDPIVIQAPKAVFSGEQLLVKWNPADTSSPQFAYRIEVFNNANFAGKPLVDFTEIDPEARQKMLAVPAGTTPFVRLTVTDIFDRKADPISITPAAAQLSPASAPAGTLPGLNYKYCEGDWKKLPNFAGAPADGKGATAFPDLTPRRRRENYAFNFSGFLEVPADGIYTFALRSADGAKLVIDGKKIVDHDGLHSPSEKLAGTALAKGKHAVEISYFFTKQASEAGDDIDNISLRYAGPGFELKEIPFAAWSRMPAKAQPKVALESPAQGATLPAGQVTLTAKVTPAAGAVVQSVRFYVDQFFAGEAFAAPYSINVPFWNKAGNNVRARVVYNDNNTVDSEVRTITTTPEDLTPWTLAGASEHNQAFGGKIAGGKISLIGDGLNICYQEITSDCTVVTRVADMIPPAPGIDGKHPDWAWQAGIIFRESLTPVPGMPLGNSAGNNFAALFATVGEGAYFQDATMCNQGGPFRSKRLGNQRWLKIQRTGNVFESFVSDNGTDWKSRNKVTLKNTPAKMYVGVYTYAAPSENTNVHRAVFAQTKLTPGGKL